MSLYVFLMNVHTNNTYKCELSYNDILTSIIQLYVGWIASVTIYPGEKEMDALVTRTSSVLVGKENAIV